MAVVGTAADWCAPEANWQIGPGNRRGGALAGTFLVCAHRLPLQAGLGKEALGLGDADLMMMAGAFLGWQVVVVAFFLSVIPALLFGIIQVVVHRDNSLPFGPSLSIGVMATSLAWEPIGTPVCAECALRRPPSCSGVVVLCSTALFVMSFALRPDRHEEEPES